MGKECHLLFLLKEIVESDSIVEQQFQEIL
jgi:hypothetical protein